MSRELDEQCGRAMGWIVRDVEWVRSHRIWEATADSYWTDEAAAMLGGGARIPDFSADPAAARLLEDEIERRGEKAINRYLSALWDIFEVRMGAHRMAAGQRYEWAFLRAAPEQRARAFLEAVEE